MYLQALLLMLPVVPALGKRLSALKGTTKKASEVLFALLGSAGLILLLLVCICYLVKGTYNPFIYFNF